MQRLVLILIALLSLTEAAAQSGSATIIRFPDVTGYKTLKCDFHLHTVFSDGNVWPTFRVQEAWSEGLDAIAITDHLEYLPKKEYLKADMNTSVTIARPAAKQHGLILIAGAEITRKMPPGHLNALFVKDANALVKDDWKDVVLEAKKQDAIIMWNHPGWVSQQPDGIARWYEEHTFLLGLGNFFGAEIVNGTDFYPEVLQWCLEKNLTVLGSSDSHDPIKTEYDPLKGEHRPITLVFATERSAEAVREALLAGRTAVYTGNELIGRDEHLRPLVHASLSWSGTTFSVAGREWAHVIITNLSQLGFDLVLATPDDAIQLPRELRLEPGRSTVFSLRARSVVEGPHAIDRRVNAVYSIKNCSVGNGKKLEVAFPLDVRITRTN